jgi:hypothetical protein
MRGSWSRRTALAIWFACAFVTWNVVFDRGVNRAAVEFTQQQIERHARGEPTRTINEAFRPRLGDAALTASVWGAAVLASGLIVIRLAARPS